jgi:hypothetical protein
MHFLTLWLPEQALGFGFAFPDHIAAAHAPDALQTVAHCHQAAFEIYVGPLQADAFADSQGKRYGNGEQGFEPVATYGLKQLPGLLGRIDIQGTRLNFRRVNFRGGITLDQLIVDGLIESCAQRGAEVFYGACAQARIEFFAKEIADMLRP